MCVCVCIYIGVLVFLLYVIIMYVAVFVCECVCMYGYVCIYIAFLCVSVFTLCGMVFAEECILKLCHKEIRLFSYSSQKQLCYLYILVTFYSPFQLTTAHFSYIYIYIYIYISLVWHEIFVNADFLYVKRLETLFQCDTCAIQMQLLLLLLL